MEASFVPQSNHGIMDEKEEDEELGSMSSFSSFSDDDDDDDDEGGLRGGSGNSIGSSSTDSISSSSSLEGPLFEMSSLISQLPFKRGLSMHFEGKSQSFTSLSSVKNLEDLVKPERPLRRKRVIKSSKNSYGWGLASSSSNSHNKKLLSPRGSSRTITKKNSTGTSRMVLTSSSLLGTWKQ